MIAGLRTPVVIAHRGGAWDGLAGEQTAAHFERAVAIGVDFIEVDLRRTADRRIVCVHDPEHAGRPVATSTYAELLEASRAASLPAPALLGELVELTRGRVRLDLELKAGGFEDQLLAELGRDREGAVFKSFQDVIVRRLEDLGATAGLLLGVEKPRLGPITRAGELFPELRLLRCGADFVSPHHRLVRFGFVARMRSLGRPVLVWTVNEDAAIARFLAEADGVITDRPARAMALRAPLRA